MKKQFAIPELSLVVLVGGADYHMPSERFPEIPPGFPKAVDPAIFPT